MKSVPVALVLIASAASCLAATSSFEQTGTASWYGAESGRCASGERYNPAAMTAAHRTLPLGTNLRVTNMANQKSVVVRVNDRGPYTRKRILDLSKAAALELQMTKAGTARVKLEVIASR